MPATVAKPQILHPLYEFRIQPSLISQPIYWCL